MNSFIGWVGGKSRLRKYIIPMIPADATRYVEVFGGAGWVLFGRDHRRLKAILSTIKGRFILSYNDCDFIRKLYDGFKFTQINRKNLLSAADNNKKDYAELLITNF